MPFMKGRAPIRRTLQYLERGDLVFKDCVRIMTVNYNAKHKPSRGAYEFVFWHLPQIQYKNPEVQLVTFKNMTPTPFFQFVLDDCQKIVVDVDNQSKESIYEHIKQTFCKSEEQLKAEAFAREKKANPANFGVRCHHHCICEIPGQVPCPGWVPLPKELRGKHRLYGKDVQE